MALYHINVSKRNILTPERRAELIQRLEKKIKGETGRSLAAEFGITHQAVAALRKKLKNDAAAGGLGRYISAEESEQLKKIMLTTVPADHKLLKARTATYAPERWTQERAHALGEKKLGRVLRKHQFGHLVKAVFPNERESIPTEAIVDPVAITSKSPLDKEFRKDKKFMAYLNSPISKQIIEKETEMARKMFEQKVRKENPEADIEHDEEAFPHPKGIAPPRPIKSPGIRVGKHKSSKGSPFTKPKKRRKR